MQRILPLAALSLMLLAGCSTSGAPGMSVNLGVGGLIGRHVGLGTSVNIPVGLGNKTSGSNSGINTIEEKIVTYFTAQGQTSEKAVQGGFYRQLISKRGTNEYIVQDFYSDNNQKRTDPMEISRNQLMNFRAHPENGSLIVYAHNGTIMQQQVYQNGRLISAKY